MRYSKWEAYIANILNNCPLVKQFTKQLYYRLCRLVYRKPYKFELSPLTTDFITAEYKTFASTFFGYYDKSPWSPSQRKIIYHAIDYPSTKLPDPSKPVSIILADADTANPVCVAKTHAWNWQQGSRLHWLSENVIMFNDYDQSADCYVSKIVNLNAGSQRQVYPAVNDTAGNLGLAVNYDRLQKLRPDYGYSNRPNALKHLKPVDEKDGIWKVSLINSDSQLFISLSQLVQLKPRESMRNAWHKVNHVMISPMADKFIFLHRWFVGSRKYTRLICSSCDISSPTILLDEDMVSHCCWYDNETVFCWARHDKSNNYFLVNTQDHQVQPYGKFALLGDGHPTACAGKNFIITDSYPDRSGMRRLLRISTDSRKINELGQFYEPLRYSGQTRCDLHPRLSPDFSYLSFDTVANGKRRMALLQQTD